MLRGLAVRADADEMTLAPLNLAMSWRDAQQVPLMRSLHCSHTDDRVAVPRKVFYRKVGIRKGMPQALHQSGLSFRARRGTGKGRVVDVVVGEQMLESCEVAVVERSPEAGRHFKVAFGHRRQSTACGLWAHFRFRVRLWRHLARGRPVVRGSLVGALRCRRAVAAQAVDAKCCWSLSRLWVAARSRHSVLAAALRRLAKRVQCSKLLLARKTLGGRFQNDRHAEQAGSPQKFRYASGRTGTNPW